MYSFVRLLNVCTPTVCQHKGENHELHTDYSNKDFTDWRKRIQVFCEPA